MTEAPLRLGTRRSALAMAQSGQVAEAVTRLTGRAVELVEITTQGDVSREQLTQIGGTGVFVNALRDALHAGEVDFVVHSLKDLPTGKPDGITLAAVPRRHDPRDVLVARDGLALAELPAGSRIGTGSPRRAAQLRLLGLGHEILPIRGNVDTRVGYVRSGKLDGVVLARAGLGRLDRAEEVTETFDPLHMLPAPGQGALAVECAAHDAALVELLAGLDDSDTRAAVLAERTLLAVLEAGCSAPVGALCEVAEGEQVTELYLRAVVANVDGTDSVRLSATGTLDEAEKIGRELAAELLARGASGLMGERVP
ncbi:hydroxymethylbilane synthase [Embleya scabrispora]|uniref:Porphobilinogen deaminase n=1 Tax=Embleya scabrispora TaxID=159449 RepID=A0A1T3NZT3_9ACTN|nr:hydroxymethylbilane synthase [Embleya scabrispora]OPC82358.1 hydroxymethylbilane synthase [Embleya scabrispora]